MHVGTVQAILNSWGLEVDAALNRSLSTPCSPPSPRLLFQLPAHPLGCWRQEISAFTQSLQLLLLERGSLEAAWGREGPDCPAHRGCYGNQSNDGFGKISCFPTPTPPPPEGRSQRGVWMSIKSRRLLGKPGRQRQRQGVALKVQHCQPRPALLSIGTERSLNHNTGRPHF